MHIVIFVPQTQQNSQTLLQNLESRLSNLEESQRQALKWLLLKYDVSCCTFDVLSRTDEIYHNVGVGDAAPVKQHSYRPKAIKQQYHKEEIKYLLADDFIEPSCSGWSSVRILVPKPGGGY